MLSTCAQVLDGQTAWTPDSWRERIAAQQPHYADVQGLRQAATKLRQAAPLVSAQSIDLLKTRLAQAQQGRAFVLQGGDCAEAFADTDPAALKRMLVLMEHMSQALMPGLQRPLIKIGRLAGQYAKPRSSDIETYAGLSLPVYRGDIVNQAEFCPQARRADPARLLQAYAHSANTLEHAQAIQAIMHSDNLAERSLFISHEALLLEYEQSLTRQQADGRWLNQSTHLPWIGLRTAQPDGAHVEYLRGVDNPLAVKVGADTTASDLLQLIERLNPGNQPGRLTLIHRVGALLLGERLGALIDALKRADAKVLWLCDPMHGNTRTLPCATKTRAFDDILAEIAMAFRVHARHGSILGGLHLEMTGEAVTECLGGPADLQPSDLGRRYLSKVDPRLNGEQALELARRVSLDRLACSADIR
ncbi:MAG: 3-deoxy-7-phosphoheptulonate synthase [Gammaproteobacteria bacterium]